MRFVYALLFSLVGAAAAMAAGNTQGITATTIKIGMIGPYSGVDSAFDPLDYGPAAYLRYVNSQGGVNGRKFDIVFADSACNETQGIAAAKKLIYQDKVFMIMGQPCSGVTMAIKPMLLATGVPWMGSAANPHIAIPTSPGIFADDYNGEASGDAMAAFAMSKPGVTKIALVMHSNDWAHGYCDASSAYIKSHGGSVVATTILDTSATDATAQVLRIKASGAQAVMGCLYQQALIVFLRAMHEYGVHVPVVAALGADFDQVVRDVGNIDAVKQVFFQPYQFQAPIGQGPLKKFHDIFLKYLAKSELPANGVPTNFYYFGVPVAIVAVEGFKLAGPEPTRESWIAAIESLKGFQTGVLADTETMSATDHVGVERMYAVGLNEAGKETLYEAWGKKLAGE
ncbi:MAG TPA: ABC transporter substrate-binding protein [Acetobacteraceae bacterium]|nr:ABC transporter substrate-binding protein [Acetobacteraceae bacterium]